MESFSAPHRGRLRGRARLGHVLPTGLWLPATPYRSNDIMADWATIASNFFVTGDSRFRVSMMYLEFENVADPDDPVTIPSFDTTDGIEYYQGLSQHASRDYLRVFLSGSSVSTTDSDQWPSGNVSQFFSMSSGVVGVHGKTFSDANNSKLFGAALVAVRDAEDAAQDLILSRLYFTSAEQQVKLATSQLGVDWLLELN